MRKILLDFRIADTKEKVQEYLMLSFGFPDYYGRNLDALFDMLTGLREDTCVGIFGIDNGREALAGYLKQVKRVLQDAEEENPYLCVILRLMRIIFVKRNGRGHLKAEGENRANSRTAAEQKEILKNSNQDKGKES